MATPGDRLPLQDLSHDGNIGNFCCTYCGCADFRVVNTWRLKDGTIRRQRVCRHCGKGVIWTEETPRAPFSPSNG